VNDATHPELLDRQQIPEDAGPQLPWLAVGFLLTGLGTALLGPILPAVAKHWHLTDAVSGRFFLVKFIGAFLGGISVPRRLRLGIFSGTLFCTLGFAGFAMAPTVLLAAVALLVGGFGLGQIIASTNILAGRRYQQHTGSALASLNFFWSLGAVTTGLLAASLIPRFGLRTPLLGLAGLFLLIGIGGFFAGERNLASTASTPVHHIAKSLAPGSLVIFALLLFLYGGVETCLTSWLTTFSIRFSDHQLVGGQSAVILFWLALTSGRLLATLLLRFIPERILQTVSLATGALCIAALTVAHHSYAISLDCILMGLTLAPFFPATFAILMRKNPPARTAGFILAVSGLGAAFFPWLMGLISTSQGSLRIAMTVPIGLALLMLLLTCLPAHRYRA
jgi:fucose permease